MKRSELVEKSYTTKQAISKAIKEGRIPVDKKGNIPDYHEDTIEYIKNGIERHANKNRKPLVIKNIGGFNEPKDYDTPPEPDSDVHPKRRDLDLKKLKAEIKLKEKQGRKLDLEYAIRKRDLLPASLVGISIGHFAMGIKTNFLTIGNKIARGDTELRDRIEKLVKSAIEKTVEGAEKGLERDGIKLLDPKEIIEGE